MVLLSGGKVSIEVVATSSSDIQWGGTISSTAKKLENDEVARADKSPLRRL